MGTLQDARGLRLQRRAGLLACSILSALLHVASLNADSIKTVAGEILRGKSTLTTDGIAFSQENGGERIIKLSEIQAAVFVRGSDVISGEQSIGEPWAAQDIGSVAVAGGAREDGNGFILRGSGMGIRQGFDSFQFVYRQMAGDGSIIARIKSVSGTSQLAVAGLAIRQTLGPESAHAAVLLDANDQTSFCYRVSRKRPNPEMRGPGATAPAWLRLEKRDKFFTGSVSHNGRDWKVVGSQTIDLGGARNKDDQWYFGFVMSAYANGDLATAIFDDVRVSMSGLKAETFSGEFQTLLKSEIAGRIDRNWEGNPPDAMRWSGLILPNYSEVYTFAMEPKEASRLWIGEKLVLNPEMKSSEPIRLERGKAYALRIESQLSKAKRPSAKFQWSSSSQRKETVPPSALRPFADRPQSYVPSGIEVDLTRVQASAAGLVLKNGTLIAGTLKEGDDSSISLRAAGGEERKLSTFYVSRLQFRALSPQMAARISDTPGVLLANGDFIEGDLKKFSNGSIQINSVIFGEKFYDTATQAAAIVLRPYRTTGKFVVRTTSGAAFFGDALELRQDTVALTEPILGKLQLKPVELLDLRRL